MQSFLDGLEDYTIDERGDVGSWVRIACIQGLSESVLLLLESSVPDPEQWIHPDTYHQIWKGLLKQGAERLDNMRAEVGRQVVKLLTMLESRQTQGNWMPYGFSLMHELFSTQ